jgi:hypothetical protein
LFQLFYIFHFFQYLISRRTRCGLLIPQTVLGKVFLVVAALVLIGGVLTAVLVSLRIAKGKTDDENHSNEK